MEFAKCHFGDDIEQAFLDVSSGVKIIHAGMTPLLQFLDTCVNKTFKDIMKGRREDWVENGEFTDKVNKRRVSYQLVAEWSNDTWNATDDLIMNEFRQCGYIEYAENI